jgi:hypothetical protein
VNSLIGELTRTSGKEGIENSKWEGNDWTFEFTKKALKWNYDGKPGEGTYESVPAVELSVDGDSEILMLVGKQLQDDFDPEDADVILTKGKAK